MKLNKNDIIIWSLIALFLSPILFFPISTDLAIFATAGKTIFDGGKIYVDFIDLKQPLIYYIFSLFHLLTGSTEFGLRFLDFLYQFGTIILLYFTVKKYTGKQLISYISAGIYAIAYSCLNLNQTMQIENFAGFFILVLLNMQMEENKNKYEFMISGVAIGILAGLKITLGIVFFALVIDDYISKKQDLKHILRRAYMILIYAFITFCITFIPLLDSQIRHGFGNVVQYLSFYASIPPLNLESIHIGLKSTAIYFGDNFTIFMLTGLTFGIYRILKKDEEADFLKTCFVFALVLFISVAVEKKFYVYHFQRMQVVLMILSGVGLLKIWREIKDHWDENSGYLRFIIISIVIIIIPFSPIVRWLNINQGTFYYLTDNNKYAQYYEKPNQTVVLRKQHIETADFIKANSNPGDLAIVMSTASHVINYFLDDVKISRFALSCFYLGNFALPEWQSLFEDEIKQAKWLIVQDNDGNYHAFGHYYASLDMLKKNQKIYSYVKKYFVEFKQIGYFHIYMRIPD